MLESQLLKSIFRDASDLVVILKPNRAIKQANPSVLEAIPGARTGVDFMSLVSPDVQDEVLLVRAGTAKSLRAPLGAGARDRDDG